MRDTVATIRPVAKLVRGIPANDGAGVKLTRVIGSPALDSLDPFLLLDEIRSADGADYIGGFPEHPHRGFETVTYVLAGHMRHGDNKGNHGLLTPGSVQWMTAGRGIVHSEMPEQQDGLMWGFQLWVNLPAKDKMMPPRYQDIEPSRIPETGLPGGGKVRVLAGAFNGVKGPVADIVTEPLLLDVTLTGTGEVLVPVPTTHNGFAYVFDGAAVFGAAGTSVARGQIAVLGAGDVVRLAGGPGRVLLAAGKPLNEPVARYGPFVMNTPDQIRQAIADYQSGRF
ncbi:MAG: pirin family protein [Alphaproteobacteria bacterium]|nr:pirin family protein [Alphaproteobacteria bacterium]